MGKKSGKPGKVREIEFGQVRGKPGKPKYNNLFSVNEYMEAK